MESNISIKTNDSKGDDTTAAVGLCQICYSKKIECMQELVNNQKL